jgi:glyoxylase-like metal-dependent hydrolase (beta-lactamase superfamily II)
MLVKKFEIIEEGKGNGNGVILRYVTDKGTIIHCLGVPVLYSADQEWDLGATWCYLIESEKITLIDTGQWDRFEVLQSMLKKISRHLRDISQIIVTHGHEDHDGNLPEVMQDSGAEVYAHFAYRDMISYHPDINDGALHPQYPGSCRCCLMPDKYNVKCIPYHKKRSVLQIGHQVKGNDTIPGEDITFISTPGHSPDSICVLFESEVLFSGDTLLPTITPHPSLMLEYFANKRILPEGYGANNNAYGLIAYLTSLHLLKKRYGQIDILLPGHRLIEKGRINYIKPAERASEIISFHKERCENILSILGEDVLSLEGISQKLFDPKLRKGWGKYLSQREVMSHLELLAVQGDVDWVNPKEFTSRATGKENYRDYFNKLI